MHNEQINEGTPFQEECNTKHFFVGGGRGAILNDIKTALQGKVHLVTLIGEEGSGKTMLCKMLQEQWKTRHRILFLPQLVESFEDIVRVAAQECDLQYPVDANRADAKKIFLTLVATLRAKGESLLLVCDEAEKMYLATLERIRKVLDEVNADGGGLQLLLSGRKSLTTNLEQLALCNFEKISEKQFFLSALDDNETWSYLNFCVQGLRGDEQQEVFTMEAAGKIASMGRGNLRLINVYAEESLQSSSADTSFLVLLDHVKDDGPGEELLSSSSGVVSRLLQHPKYLIGGGAAVCLLLLVFLFPDDDEKKSAEFTLSRERNPVFTAPPLKNPVQKYSSSEKKSEKTVSTPVAIGKVDKATALETPKKKREGEHLQEKEPVEVVTLVSVEPRVPVQHTPVEISPVEIVEKPETESYVPELDTGSRISADKRKRLINPRIESSQKKNIPERSPVFPDTAVASSRLVKDPVLGKFFVAGEKWQTGGFDSSFSVQLMALKSDQAEENLKQIVSQPDYQAIADKLVMLEKPSDPPVLLVFYGVYSSMSAARSARNNMPIFLRDRHPYPVSVRGAVEKARVE